MPTWPGVYAAPSCSWVPSVERVGPGVSYNDVYRLGDFATTLQNKNGPFQTCCRWTCISPRADRQS
ncbi:hypothetical protein GGR58DRAFT_493801 [Xylaria digitata]|nr:hypothetical protein GGR58DRAFT_493801 [Xylaria digitata]